MHPVLFRIPVPRGLLAFLGNADAIPIYSYGVMLGLSLVIGWYVTLGLCEKSGLDREQMANCYVITAILAVLGSRVMFLATNPSEFHGVSDFFALRGGGLVAYGGFLGGFLGSWAFLRWKKLRLLPWADAAVPSLATGLVVTRLGCYLFGCDYGRPLSSGAPAWLARLGTFPRWAEGLVGQGTGSPAWIEHVQRGLVAPDASHSLPVHPTQLYESAVGAAIFALLVMVRKNQRFRGQLFFVATFAYGLLRFLLELVRDDPERGAVPIAAPRHLLVPVCLALFAAAFCIALADTIERMPLRRICQVGSFLPAVWAALTLRPEPFAPAVHASLSTSQFIGLSSALVVAAFFWVHQRAASANPVAAMDVGSGVVKDADPADGDAD
ncbi:MAG: prolipoprotein diacylglyceryl transferase [Deltaproteobacteria bacterium]|nr:prolipoprotein diacylglyceryl transferase [Deltaproteobacteria bacterium]